MGTSKVLDFIKRMWRKSIWGKLLVFLFVVYLWPLALYAFSGYFRNKYPGKKGYVAAGLFIFFSLPVTAGWINGVVSAVNGGGKTPVKSTQSEDKPTTAPTSQPNTSAPTSQPAGNRVTAIVFKVIDGDTLDFLIDGKQERVRVIGINTPETVDPRKPVECFGREASNKAKELLSVGEEVQLEADSTQSDRDQFNRLLRYVWMDGGTADFGKVLISSGYAYEYTYDIPYKYQTEYKQAQKAAETGKVGLWADAACAVTPKPTTRPTVMPTIRPTSVSVLKPTPTIAVPPPINNPPPANTSGHSCTGPDLDCPDFTTQAQAQAFFDSCGFTATNDPMKLDNVGIGDGVACESLP